jgi:hypothetical protein
MNKVLRFCLALVVIGSFLLPLAALSPAPVFAATTEDLINKSKCSQDELHKADCVCTDATAQNCSDPAVNADCAGASASCNIVAKYINPFIRLLGILAGLAITIGIIAGGIQYASSGGDPQAAASGKKHIKAAVIGLIGLLFMYAFLRFLSPAGVTG